MAKAKKWNCVENCGACCKLEPGERQEAIAVLTNEERILYMSMVGDDGWCKHFDKVSRKCKIYSQRPSFCKVDKMSSMFDVPDEMLDIFAISCCKQQIRFIYGGRSKVMKNFCKKICFKY